MWDVGCRVRFRGREKGEERREKGEGVILMKAED